MLYKKFAYVVWVLLMATSVISSVTLFIPQETLAISSTSTPSSTQLPIPSTTPIPKKLSVPYVSQKDPRWAQEYVGDWTISFSGCGVSSLSSIFTSLLEHEVLPTEIANTLHAEGYFNNALPGTTSASVVKAAQLYNVKYSQLITSALLREALRNGKIVTMAIEAYSPLNDFGDTHALTLYGYDPKSDTTNVYEPYNEAHNGAYQIDWLFNMRSTKKSDLDWHDPYYIFALWKD